MNGGNGSAVTGIHWLDSPAGGSILQILAQASRTMNEAPERLRSNATKCRDLASNALTSEARDVLQGLAEQYDKEAAELETSESPKRRRPAFKWPLEGAASRIAVSR